MAGYLRSTNPTAANRRIADALSDLDRFENTEAYKARRSAGMSIRAALSACNADPEICDNCGDGRDTIATDLCTVCDEFTSTGGVGA